LEFEGIDPGIEDGRAPKDMEIGGSLRLLGRGGVVSKKEFVPLELVTNQSIRIQ
jgi:hypothetical protein